MPFDPAGRTKAGPVHKDHRSGAPEISLSVQGVGRGGARCDLVLVKGRDPRICRRRPCQFDERFEMGGLRDLPSQFAMFQTGAKDRMSATPFLRHFRRWAAQRKADFIEMVERCAMLTAFLTVL